MIKEQKNKVELLSRELSPAKAKASINGLISKINQQLNQESLEQFEKGVNGQTASSLQAQLSQLKVQQQELNDRIGQAEGLGCDVQFSLKFELNLIK